MTVTAAHNGGMDHTTTHATRMRRRAPNPFSSTPYYSANSKGSALDTKLRVGDAPQELQTHLLKSSKNSTRHLDEPLAAGASEAWALFAHADKTDYWLMAGGLVAAMVSGASLPSINIVFGKSRANS